MYICIYAHSYTYVIYNRTASAVLPRMNGKQLQVQNAADESAKLLETANTEVLKEARHAESTTSLI